MDVIVSLLLDNMVKEKPNSTRIYDEEGFRRRAACICVRNEDEKEVLLVTSSRRPEHWIIPGGGVEPEEEASVTAIREVLEEAGVLGKLGRSLGVFELRIDSSIGSSGKRRVLIDSRTQKLEGTVRRIVVYQGGCLLTKKDGSPNVTNMERKHRTEVFVMVVSEELPEWEDSQSIDRKRKWFTLDEALNQLAQHKPAQLTYLQSMLSCRNDKVT